MTSLSAADLRANLQRHEGLLRTHSSRQFVCNIASNIAKSISSDCLAAARSLPAARPPRKLGASLPDARDEAFDAAIDVFIALSHESINEIEAQEIRVKSNAGLTRKECRAQVLAFLGGVWPAQTWLVDLVRALALSPRQVLDALEQLESQNALKPSIKSTAIGGEFDWLVSLNAHGRDLAENDHLPEAGGAFVFQQHFHNSQIANAGIAHGPVTQAVTINSDVAEALAALSQLQKDVSSVPNGVTVEALAHLASVELQKEGWGSRATLALTTLGAAVQSVAAAKPAYQILQPIAAAHGIPLPPWN